jgi:hypothetical protein
MASGLASKLDHDVSGASCERLPERQIMLLHNELGEVSYVSAFRSPIPDARKISAVRPVSMGHGIPKCTDFSITKALAYFLEGAPRRRQPPHRVEHRVAQVHEGDVELRDHLSSRDFWTMPCTARPVHPRLKCHQFILSVAKRNQIIPQRLANWIDAYGDAVPMHRAGHAVSVCLSNADVVAKLRRITRQLLVEVCERFIHSNILRIKSSRDNVVLRRSHCRCEGELPRAHRR